MMVISFFVFYGGPDQLMPITSGLATLLAFLLMFWNKVVGLFARLFHHSKPEAIEKTSIRSDSSTGPNQVSDDKGPDNR